LVGWLVNLNAKFGSGLNTTALRRLIILFGTESGNSEEVARSLAAHATSAGLAPVVIGMAEYAFEQLASEQDVLIVVSTAGEGDPPYTATRFFDFVEASSAPKLDLIRFAVIALGDSTYEFFCGAGRRLDRRFGELGANRLHERVDCDIDYMDTAKAWMKDVVNPLRPELNGSIADETVSISNESLSETLHGKRNPYPATILDNRTLVGAGIDQSHPPYRPIYRRVRFGVRARRHSWRSCQK
jgi:sulfite reductase (NADPH) flavoprotein alpha-component